MADTNKGVIYLKHYKNLIPVLLILFIAVSWYLVIDNTAKIKKEYDNNIAQAEKYAKEGIMVDAMNYYNAALGIKDTINLRMDILELYFKNMSEEETLDYAAEIMNVYPKEKRIYERMMDYYVSAKSYTSAFSLYDKAVNLGIVTNKMKDTIDKIKYEYHVLETGYSEVRQYINGMCAVSINDYWGIVDEGGAGVLSVQYKGIGNYTSEFIPVLSEDEKNNEKWQIIDIQGNKRRVLPEVKNIKSIGSLSCGVYPLETSEGYQYYTSDAKEVFDKYTYAGTMYDNYAVVLDNEDYHLIDISGKKASDSFERIEVNDNEVGVLKGRYFGKKDEKYALYSMEGKKMGKEVFDEAEPFTAEGSYAAVEKDGKWGFVDEDGKIVIKPQYQEAHSFSNGYAAVKKDNHWGFIDYDNKICINPQFEDAKYFNSKGNVFVKLNGVWTMISLYLYNH